MQKKTLSFVIASLGIIALSIAWFSRTAQAATYPYQQLATYAIQLTKQATTGYGTYEIPATSSTAATMVYLRDSDILTAENNFKNAVNSAWNTWYTTSWYTGFLANLANRNQTQINTIQNWQLDIATRWHAMLSSDFYKNYITLWNNPKFNNGNMAWTRTSTSATTTYWTRTSGSVFTPVKTYTTTSQKIYYIWSSQDDRYWFSRLNNIKDMREYWFRDLPTLYNYVEYQNRIIYTAPNSRKYGIFKYDYAYRFSRDEGSISDNEWMSVTDVQAYINQHNQPVEWCTVVKERHCVQ